MKKYNEYKMTTAKNQYVNKTLQKHIYFCRFKKITEAYTAAMDVVLTPENILNPP